MAAKKSGGKTWPWIVGLGAGAIGGGMLLLLSRRPSKPKDYDIEDDKEVEKPIVVDEAQMPPASHGGDGFLILGKVAIPDKAILGIGVDPGKAEKPSIIIANVTGTFGKRRSPLTVPGNRGGPVYTTNVGWLGPVMLFGQAIQGAYIDRLVKRGHPAGWDSFSEWADTRYNRRYAEFPPPINSPHLFRLPLSGEPNGGSVQLVPTIGVSFIINGTRWHNDRPWWGARVADQFERYTTMLSHWFTSAASWRDWGFDPAMVAHAKMLNIQHNNNKFSNTKPASGKVDVQVLRYYWKARWIVWAAEMYREHYAYRQDGKRNIGKISTDGVPIEWRIYCLQWGIGIPTRWRLEHRNMFDLWSNGVNPDVVMERIMEQIPPPGRIPAGSELSGNLLADWPQNPSGEYRTVQIGPPWPFFESETRWENYCKAKQQGSSNLGTFQRAYMRAIGAIMAAVASYMGAAAAAAPIGAAAGGVLGTAVEVGLKELLSMSENYMLSGNLVFDWRNLLLAIGAGTVDAVKDMTDLETIEQCLAVYEQYRNAIDIAWGYGNDLMTAVEAESMNIDMSDYVSDYV